MTWRRVLLICSALAIAAAALAWKFHTPEREIDPGREVFNRTTLMFVRTFDKDSNPVYVYVSHGPGKPEADDYKSFRVFYGPLDRMEPVEVDYVDVYRCKGWQIQTKAGTLNTSVGQHHPGPSWAETFAIPLDISQYQFREYERVVRINSIHPGENMQVLHVLPVRPCREG